MSSLMAAYHLVSLIVFAVSSLSSSASSLCPSHHELTLLLNSLQSQCPTSYSSNSPLEVDGDYFDRVMTSKQRNSYTCVLFYASWCPFSQKARSTLEVLSLMFPQIEHLAVEKSSAMPSVFSRYGIHGVPSILMVDQTSSWVRYRGKKDLQSLVKFYKGSTGLEPVQYFTEEHLISYEISKNIKMDKGNDDKSSSSSSSSWVKEMIRRDIYLVLSVLFICMRIIALTLPKAISFAKALWASYVPQNLNLFDIFGETSQMMLGRLLQMIDVQRIWTKLRLRLCKTRNFHQGAQNARAWASSLASVSVGQASRRS